ncbi:hypothetical protein CM49_02625 [Paenibacillus sp. P1XP2]|nr:hypothetical protein CM49_02625 [Paenibacillus sp. P1XP2]
MEHSIEVMRKTLELMDSCIEGVEYIAWRLHEGKMEHAFIFWRILFAGFAR